MNVVTPLCPCHVAFSRITTLLRHRSGKAEGKVRILPYQCETMAGDQESRKGRGVSLRTATEALFLHVGVTGPFPGIPELQ